MKSVAEKMGIKPNSRSILINPPDKIHRDLSTPKLELSNRLSGDFDYIHFFARDIADLKKNFKKLRTHLSKTGMLWISWLKGRKNTDLTLTKIIEIGYDHGLVESKVLAVNGEWSAMKFTNPKEGKVYNNSYGKLK